MNDQNVRMATAIDLQQKILEAQDQQAALARRNAELEATVAAFERWDTEAARYRLVDLWRRDVCLRTESGCRERRADPSALSCML
jgi:hypothetical protein